MSATNRGAEYVEHGAYNTRIKDARFLVSLLDCLATPQLILEPSVGDGHIVEALLERELTDRVFHRYAAVDINPEARGLQTVQADGGWATVGDFLETPLPWRPTLVIGNPPFAEPVPPRPCPRCTGAEHKRCKGTGWLRSRPKPLAMKHIQHALRVVTVGGHVAFLLRFGIMETRPRLPFWLANPPKVVFFLAERPGFGDAGTDMASYGFFVWQRGYRGTTELRIVAPPEEPALAA